MNSQHLRLKRLSEKLDKFGPRCVSLSSGSVEHQILQHGPVIFDIWDMVTALLRAVFDWPLG